MKFLLLNIHKLFINYKNNIIMFNFMNLFKLLLNIFKIINIKYNNSIIYLSLI